MNRLVVNLRRATVTAGSRKRRCVVCGEREFRLGTRAGAEALGSLASEAHYAGICSWECYARFYNLLDGRGRPTCYCGKSVRYVGADCLPCQQTSREDTKWLYGGSLVFPTA